jgi:Dit-like phage tail protein
MAIENLFIRNERSIAGIQVDGVLRESTFSSVRMTTNPVEVGADITDHVIDEPISFILDGVVTDTPIGLAAVTDSIGGALDINSGLSGSSDKSGQTRSQQLYEKLVNLLSKKDRIEIKSKLKTYDDLIFISISVDQDKDTSLAVFFTAVFQQAFFVEGAESSGSSQDSIGGDKNKVANGATESAGTISTTQPTGAGIESILS